MVMSDLGYGLASTALGWVVSEAVPAISKGKYGGVLHVIFAIGSKLYGGQDSVADLRQDVANLKVAIEALQTKSNPSVSSDTPNSGAGSV